jgi:hypothetical protein
VLDLKGMDGKGGRVDEQVYEHYQEWNKNDKFMSIHNILGKCPELVYMQCVYE